MIDLRKEAVKSEEIYIPKYSIIVHFYNGATRGYMISAPDAKAMMEKLMSNVNMDTVVSVNYSTILRDQDVML